MFLTKVQMFRFTVHGFLRNETKPSTWVLATYTFGHKNLQTCQMWVNRLNASLNLEVGRPRNLMVCSAIGQHLALYIFLFYIHRLVEMNFSQRLFLIH